MDKDLKNEIKSELETRMNFQDFTISSNDLIDIINLFDATKEEVVFIYSEIVSEIENDLRGIVQDVVQDFKQNGVYYPSFFDFKKMFDEYGEFVNVNEQILRNMFKKEVYDENQISLFESVKNKFMNTEEDDDTERIIRQWGGELKKEKSAKLSPEDIFDVIDAGEIARNDIEGEFGEDEFLPMDGDEYRGIMSYIDESDEIKGLFKITDANGDEIKRHSLVNSLDNKTKKGRVLGFGDDGSGGHQVIVSWEWPIDMKFTNPEEMGKERVSAKSLVIAQKDNMLEGEGENKDFQFDTKSLYHWFKDALYQLDVYSEEEIAEIMEKTFERDYDYKLKMNKMENVQELNENNLVDLDVQVYNAITNFRNAGGKKEAIINHLNSAYRDYDKSELEESGRGLGHGVKNSGNRNVKMRPDHQHAPLTNLNESINLNINKLFEDKVTKKQLENFIREQAKEVASKIKK